LPVRGPATPHVEGHEVSAATYRRYGCRCAGCSAANTEYCGQRRRQPYPSKLRLAEIEIYRLEAENAQLRYAVLMAGGQLPVLEQAATGAQVAAP
jgi:hypothetical protein